MFDAQRRSAKVGHQTQNVELGARRWSASIREARKQVQDNPRYIEVRYEDLLSSCNEVLARLFSFCGLPFDESQVDEIAHQHSFERMREERRPVDPEASYRTNAGHFHKDKAGTWQEEMTARELRQFCMFAGEDLVDLGYAKAAWVRASMSTRLGSPEFDS